MEAVEKKNVDFLKETPFPIRVEFFCRFLGDRSFECFLFEILRQLILTIDLAKYTTSFAFFRKKRKVLKRARINFRLLVTRTLMKKLIILGVDITLFNVTFCHFKQWNILQSQQATE